MVGFLSFLRPVVISVLQSVKPVLEQLSELECRISSGWVRSAHHRLGRVQWGLPPQPENFDHHIDLYSQWQKNRDPQWLERGVYGGLALKGGDVLELCCGDGFNARNFYSLRSRSIVACDFEPAPLRTAEKKNAAPNVRFVRSDIRTDMPQGIFDNVIWDSAMEHFTPAEIEAIVANVKERLSDEGIFSGHTIVERAEGTKQLSHHEYEFKDKKDLQRFLTPHFKNVWIFETEYYDRHNLYFWASDGPVPFSFGWEKSSASWE